MLGIDGDLLVYRVGFAAQKELYKIYLKGEAGVLASIEGKTAVNKWLEEVGLEKDEVDLTMEIVVDPIENALHSVKMMIEGMVKALEDPDYIIYLTGTDNFRYLVLPSYKAGRGPKPALYSEIREYLVDRHRAVVVDGWEADDALGDGLASGKIDILCSYDKDLFMIAGAHYDFVKEELFYISEEEARNFYYAQLMEGDRTDNICGIRGYGRKTSIRKILDQPERPPEEVAKEEYMKFWGDDWEEVWECNTQLIGILGHEA